MKATTGVMMILLISLIKVETAVAGWYLPIPNNLRQLGAACDGYYIASTEDKKQLQLMRAVEALTRIKTEDQINEKTMIATLQKYKSIKPKSVAVVILALDTCKPETLKEVLETVATPHAVKWAKRVAAPSDEK